MRMMNARVVLMLVASLACHACGSETGGTLAGTKNTGGPGKILVPNVPDEFLRKATFAAGCFWGVEEAFRQTKGVVATEVGYAGGTTVNPTYTMVSTGTTGHAESVQVTYDARAVSYAELLDAFWTCHDPTQLDRQGPDVGPQYRSVIFFADAEQEKIARASLKEVAGGKWFAKKIVTQIVPVGTFTPGEEYHQQYLAKNGGVCHLGPATVRTELAATAEAARVGKGDAAAHGEVKKSE